MSRLTLSFLGVPDVRWAGHSIKFRTRKELALLIYLVVEGKMHSREKLTTLLWPESDTAHGHMIFRRTLADLRHHIEDATATSGVLSILSERNLLGVRLSPAVELDLHVLDGVITRLQMSNRQETQQDEDSLIKQLQTTFAAFRGPFLEGFSLPDSAVFDTWVSIQRATIHRHFNAVCDCLSTLQSKRGEITNALETAGRWVADDPLHEEAVRRMMQLYAAASNREAALRVYETMRSLLLQELATQPAPETVALAEQIRREALPSSYRHALPLPTPSSMLFESPLAGRAREYATLIEDYQRVQQGHLRVVSVEGEAGIGKTRLVTDFLGWATAQGVDVLQGQAFESSGHLPYQPFADMLRRRLEQENALDDLLGDTWLVELTRLVPDVRDRYPDLPTPISDEMTARLRLHEAIARLVLALSLHRPVILFLDDIHWADTASLDACHFLGQRLKESKTSVLIVVNLRTEGLVTQPEFARWLERMQHDLPLRRLPLASLSYEETTQLIQGVRASNAAQRAGTNAVSPHIAPTTPIKEFVDWLYQETQGHPFYIAETLRALLERHLLALHPDSMQLDVSEATRQRQALQHFLPTGVHEVIRARLNRLAPAVLSLLAAGSVLDQDASFEHLWKVAGMAEDEALAALDEAIKRGVLREQKPGGRASGVPIYVFTHEKTREVMYTEAGDARRRIFHRRAFEVLSQLPGSSRIPGLLASHALSAGLIVEALRLSITAADEAMRVFAVHDACAFYEQAHQIMSERMELTERCSAVLLPDLHRLYSQLGRVYELLNNLTQACAIYQELLTLAQDTQAPVLEMTALNRLALIASRHAESIPQAVSMLERAYTLAQENEDQSGLAETEWNWAQISYYTFQMDSALTHGARALAHAVALQRPDLQAQSLNLLAYARRARGEWTEGKACAEQAYTLYKTLGNRAMEADCLGIIADIQINEGQSQKGLETARMAFQIAFDIDNRWGRVNSAIHVTRGLLECGDYEEALSVAKTGVLLARDLHFPLLLMLLLTTLGAVYRALLHFSQAHEAHLEALTINAMLPSQRYTAHCFAELCADAVLAEEWDMAQNYAQHALTSQDENVLLWAETPRWTQTLALVYGGNVEMATEGVQQFGKQFGFHRRCHISYLRSLAILARARHENEQAQAYLQEAERLSEEMNLPGKQWQMLTLQGSIYQEIGQREQAQSAFAQAATIVQELANKIEEKELRTHFLLKAQAQVRLH